MKKRILIPSIVSLLLLVGIIGSASEQADTQYQTQQKPASSTTLKATQETVKDAPTPEYKTEKVKPTCNGTSVTAACSVDGISYAKYLYHPAVAEKSHNETVTTYEEQITSYCTLCNDGTYSPSCATGRGACSHHGGVAQWNAPRYSNVPVYSTKTVIDTPAKEAYYEKIAE